MDNQRSSISLWMQAVRPFSFTASITPILLGTALAFFEQGGFNAVYFIAALVGGVLLHAGTNLVSEYFDLKIGSDTTETFGSSKILVEKLMSPGRVLRGGLTCFGVAFLIGIFLAYNFGWTIIILGLVGLAGGYFYTGYPFGYKYYALGEPIVFSLMGPLMVFGSYYVQVGALSLTPVWVSIPIAILVAAILNANNLRDIPDDKRAGFSTIPSKLGWTPSARNYKYLLLSAYVALIVMVVLKIAPIWTLVVFLSLPPSLKLLKIVKAAKPMTPKDLATLDISTAQVHFQFGLLLTIGFVLGRMI